MGCIRRTGRGLDPAGAAVAGAAAAGVLFDPLGAAVDGAARLQSAVPLVRRARRRRPGVGCTTFTKNRDRLLDGDIAAKFLTACWPAAGEALLSSEHSRSTAR